MDYFYLPQSSRRTQSFLGLSPLIYFECSEVASTPLSSQREPNSPSLSRWARVTNAIIFCTEWLCALLGALATFVGLKKT